MHHDFVRRCDLFRSRAAPGAAHAAHFEQIREIVAKRQREIDLDRTLTVIAQRDPLVRCLMPQENGAHDVNRVFRQQQVVLKIDVRIGQIDREKHVVIAGV